jgi:hypothetical protein
MDYDLRDWKKKRENYFVVSIICFVVGIYLFVKVKTESYIIKSSELKLIENLIISEKPKFEEIKGKGSRKWIEFKCVNNNTTFEIASYDYNCVNDDEIINEIDIGDTISIEILKNELENFDTDTSCEIHSLKKNKKEYLNIECRNLTENKYIEKLYKILFAIFTMTSIVFSFSKKPKIFDKVDPQVPIWIIILLLFYVLR